MADENRSISFCVPVPPSANRLYRRVSWKKHPIISPEYREWKEVAGWSAKMQLIGVEPVACRFDVEIEFPQKLRRDSDNYFKPLLDLAQNIGLVTNDGNQHTPRATPTDRTDCLVVIITRPDIGFIRKPHKPRAPRSYRTPDKPKSSEIARLERVRSRVLF